MSVSALPFARCRAAPRLRTAVLAVTALALTYGCGRPRPRETVPSVVPVPGVTDSAARADSVQRADSIKRAAADSAAQAARRDSIARDSAALAARQAPVPQGAGGQGRRCQLVLDNTPATRFQSNRDPATGRYNTFVGGGVVARCQGQDVTLVADSAEFYDTVRIYYLFGNVHYREPRANIDADRVTYFLTEERLLAEHNVRAVLPSGSTMTGPRAEYFRAVPPIRQVAQLVATGRPTMVIVQRDSTGKAGEPANLVSDQLTAVGDSLYYASGNVEITRPDLRATSDSAFIDEGTQVARLLRRPQVEGRGERAFTLRGRAIDFFSRDRLVERVVAVDSANAISGELDLRADTIDLRVDEDKLQRAYAWGPSRARAVSPERTIIADSLDVRMPEQRLREVHAIGNAYAETATDTTKLKSDERDWLRGDTIVAVFDTAATADTSSRPRIRELAASGNASSYYQIPSGEGPDAPPSVNYVRGRVITVSFDEQEVQSVVVNDQAAGVFLEPAKDGGKRPGTPGTPGPPPGQTGQPRPPITPPTRRP